jgi:hypothetical protein
MFLLRFPIVTSVACMLMLNAMNVWSHAKTDVITVSNGDQITGAMTEMTAGKLSVSTSYAGTISVKWREVSQISSRYVYEVRLDDGERIYGRFAASDIPEQLAFRSGGKDRQLDIDDVVEVRSIEDNLADKLDLQLSSTINADPRSRQLTLQANGSYDVRGGRTRFFARVNDNKTIAGEGDERSETTSSSSQFELTREFWRERGTAQSFRVLKAVYSTNDDLGIAHRGSIGFGLGRYLINNLGHEMTVSAGIQGVQERRKSCDESSFDAPPTRENPIPVLGDTNLETCNDTELFFNVSWHLYSFQDLDMDISLIGNAYPSLSDWERVRGDMNIQVSWELFDSFYWTVVAGTELDTAGDRDDIELSKSDYNLTTGVTWKY